MNRQEKIASLIGDVLIPILGYFLWNWSIYFICLFILIDQFSRELSFLIRMRILRNRFRLSLRSYVLNMLVFFGFISMMHVFNYLLYPGIGFLDKMEAFFWYKDTGIAQGFLLFPLIIFGERLRFKMNIKQFSDEMHLQSWQNHSVQLFSYFIIFLILSIGMTRFSLSKNHLFFGLILGLAGVTLFAEKLRAFFPR